MVSFQDFFSQPASDKKTKGVTQKNNSLKRSIIAHMAMRGELTFSELAKDLNISIPTATKLIDDLVREKIVTDRGKINTHGGRRPNSFGLTDSALYLAGIEVSRDQIVAVVTDLKNNIVATKRYRNFQLEDTPKCLEAIVATINGFLKGSAVDRRKLLGVGLCIAGRVNSDTGRSYKYFNSDQLSLCEILEKQLGHPVLIENDTRAKCYGEYTTGCNGDEKNIIYLNLGRGVAIGIIVEGKLYYGHSGFAGEFGHIPFFDNEIICDCGKKGCLETEISGIAIEHKMAEQIRQGRNTILRDKESIHISDIVRAARHDDNLSIELIEEAGEKIGKSVAFLINIFNPEQVIIGGHLAGAGEYLMLPLQSAVNKYSLRLVYNDTLFRTTRLDDNIGALGAAMLVRNRILGL